MLGRLSLRARLVLGVFVLAAAGLAAADAATYTSLRSFLLDRVDSTLEAGHVQVERTALGDFGPGRGGGGLDDGGRGRLGPRAQGIDWYQLRTLSGQVVRGGFLVGSGSPPRLEPEIELPAEPMGDARPERISYFTVPSTNGATTYRIRASVESQNPNRILLVATSLHDVFGTLHRLLLIELLVTAAVLAAIAGLGLWVVRLGLRPLREIEATAATIAAGDLSKRVGVTGPKTEVGRLGLSLNAMLAQIEACGCRELGSLCLRVGLRVEL